MTEQPKLDRSEGRTLEAFQVVMGILLTICLALSTWSLTTIVALQERVTRIEADRYTSADALSAEKARAAELLTIWQEIADVKKDVALKIDAADVPPPEVRNWLDRLQKRVDLLEERERRNPSGG